MDPLLNVMKVEKAPLESYADIGGFFFFFVNFRIKKSKVLSNRFRRLRKQLNFR